jgi:hypothetical protein
MAGNARERQKVMIQMSKDLYGNPHDRPGMAKVGTHAEVPTIYIPNGETTEEDCPNQIDDMCVLLQKKIADTVQTMLNTLKRDNDNICEQIVKKLKTDDDASGENISARLRGFMYFWLGLAIPFIVMILVIINAAGKEKLEEIVPVDAAHYLLMFGGAAQWIWDIVPEAYTWHMIGLFVVFTVGMLAYSKYVWKIKPRLTNAEKKSMKETKVFLEGDVQDKYEALYKQYLNSAVGETFSN